MQKNNIFPFPFLKKNSSSALKKLRIVVEQSLLSFKKNLRNILPFMHLYIEKREK